MQEVIVAPVPRDENTPVLGGDKEMFVVEGSGHLKTDRRLDCVCGRIVMPEGAELVGNRERNVVVEVETDRHDQAGGSLAARCPSIATRARRSVR